MIRLLGVALVVAVIAPNAFAGEPMSRDAVIEAARTGIDFVDNTYVQQRKTENLDLVLIDVRTQSEYELGHIPGAIWIPRGRAEFEVAEMVRDAETEIIVYCKTESRAALVLKSLVAQGYQNVTAHKGFKTWADAGLPLKNELGVLQLIEEKAEE